METCSKIIMNHIKVVDKLLKKQYITQCFLFVLIVVLFFVGLSYFFQR